MTHIYIMKVYQQVYWRQAIIWTDADYFQLDHSKQVSV